MYSKLSKHSCFFLGILLMFHHFVETQISSIDDPNNANAANNLFFFDRKSDCNGPIRNLYGLQGTIRGSDLSSLSLGPAKCVIKIKSEGQFDGNVLDIEVKAMRILDKTTTVAIYDGDGEQSFLTSYDYRSNQQKNRFYSTGNTATFIMNRENLNSYNFDIEIIVVPIRASQKPNYENNYGKDNPYAFDKFPQEYIVGMVSGFYLFILGLCLAVILRNWQIFRRLNKTWETHQLATLKAGSGFDVRSQMAPPSHISTLDGVKSRNPASQYSRSTALPKVPPSEDGDSGVYYNDENNQKRRLVNEQRETAKPSYTTNSVYSEPEDAPETFKEKIIVPSNFKGRNGRRPPSYDEAVSDPASENSSDEELEVSSNNTSVRKRPPSSDEERSDRSSVRTRSSERSRSTTRTRSTRSPTPSETESEEDSESDGSSSGHQDRARRGKHRHKKQPEPKRSHRPAQPQQTQQQPRPQLQNPNLRPPMYGAYPSGQYVPIMAGPSQFQPVPGYAPTRYQMQPQNAMAPARGPQVQPTDIPVYSYLVQRGYKPMDPSNGSNASSDSQRAGGRRLEEPDLRLDSGVEYMKR